MPCLLIYSDASSNLVYATTHSVIVVLDLRTMRVLQTMQNPRHFGPITSICLDRKRSWIIVGTSMGTLTLWDRRFGLLLKSWQVSQATPGRSTRIYQCAIHPTKGRGKWIMVALETTRPNEEHIPVTLIEVWDIEKSLLIETFLARAASTVDVDLEPKETGGVDAEVDPAAAIAALVRSRQQSNPQAIAIKRSRVSSSSLPKEDIIPLSSLTIRTIFVGSEFGGHHQSGHRVDSTDMTNDFNSVSRSSGRGFMISGSEDRRVRLWDLGRLERTAVLSGLDSELDKPTYR